MPNVVRFTLSTARDLDIPGAGQFIDGVLDVDANDLKLVARTRYLVYPYHAVEVGIVDSATPKPTLPAVPVPPPADPYPQYMDPSEILDSGSGRIREDKVPSRLTDAELRAALVPFWAASEVLTAGKVRMAPDGRVIQRIADGTARPSYDATEQTLWTIIGGSGGAVSSVAGRTGEVALASADLTDATTTGRSVLTAADATAARSVIGAGTSSLTIGTIGTTAKAGDYTPPDATAAIKGIVELATTAETTAGTDTVRAVTAVGLKAVADSKANASHTHAVTDLTATGTKDATTFLRGDNTWAVPAGGTSATAYRRVAIWNGTNYVVNGVTVTSGNRVATTFYSFLGGPDPNALGLMIDGDEWKDAT